MYCEKWPAAAPKWSLVFSREVRSLSRKTWLGYRFPRFCFSIYLTKNTYRFQRQCSIVVLWKVTLSIASGEYLVSEHRTYYNNARREFAFNRTAEWEAHLHKYMRNVQTMSLIRFTCYELTPLRNVPTKDFPTKGSHFECVHDGSLSLLPRRYDAERVCFNE